MIIIDLGNKHTIISNSTHTLHKQTTISIQILNQVHIGLCRNFKYVIYDLISTLGIKYMDQQFGRYTKYYIYDYFMNKWGKIEIGIPKYENMKYKKFNCQTLVALYLRQLIREFKHVYYNNTPNDKNITLDQYINNNKFYLTINGLGTHPYRYAIKQSCQIAGIQTPILINSTHMVACTYYYKQKICKNKIKQPQIICIIEFGDKGSSIGFYKLQSMDEKIIEVIQYKGIKIGGYYLTKLLAEWVVNQIKEQKGLDITRHSSYMGFLHAQCQNVKINIIESQEKQGFIRVPNLPDDSEFGRKINQKMLMQIFQKDIMKIIKIYQQIITKQKYKNVNDILLLGGSTAIPLFQQKIRQISGKNRKIIKMRKQDICQGLFIMQNQQITMFDISQSLYEVIGEQGFKRKLMDIGEDIPDRRSQKTKFPAGELQFNLRIQQNGVKIAHFLLQARPKQTEFGLNFQIDRNKLISLNVRTQKGRIDLPVNFQAISAQQIILAQMNDCHYFV